MPIWSLTCQHSVFERYHSDKHFPEFLPTRWRQKSTGIDLEQNYVTVALCILSHSHTRLTALCPGLPRWAGTRKVKPIWILLKQETVSGSGISWAICKSAPCSKQITMPAPHRSVFYRPDALPAAQPTASKHWRQTSIWCNFYSYHKYDFIKKTYQHMTEDNNGKQNVNKLQT